MKHDSEDTVTANHIAQIPEGTFFHEYRCNDCHWLYYQLPTGATTCPRCGNTLEVRSMYRDRMPNSHR